MDLDLIIFGEITLRQGLYVAGGMVSVIIVVKLLKKLIFPPKSNLQHSVAYACPECGWKGHVGQYAPNCPKCSRPVN